MKRDGFNERLDGIMVRAAIRLQERMSLAYFRSNLSGYLKRIGIADYLPPEKLAKGSLLEIQDEAVVCLAGLMRKARQQGYLDAFMKQINMSELLLKENTVIFKDAVQTAVKRPPLKVIKNNDDVPNKMNTSDKQRKNLHIIK
ncbi:MAG: hypothetical protein SPK53_02955 [Selenomonas sp.]|nr:hypothetical protein [Selenomonadales bacterium]MDD7763628.1 hypothetical protein [Selenomonadales bacterium]MDY5716707.1 hypothetical protein [Selenomonas sp.]